MAEGQANQPDEQQGNVAVVSVPAEHVQQVMDYIASLDEPEVTGHAMMSPRIAAAKGISGTSCNITGFNSDFNCLDSDQSRS